MNATAADVGDIATVEVGKVAHGGHCVARLDGQVVFVRHALPGERVRIKITERTKRFLRADAVEVLAASEDRVEPPCRFAGVCGGCDFQHVSVAAQRRLLTSVVREQLQRLADVEWTGEVEAVHPDDLGWRTRVTYAVTERGKAGLRRHRSHDVVEIDHCLIAHPSLAPVSDHRWSRSPVEVIWSSSGQRLLVTDSEVASSLETQLDGIVSRAGHVRSGSSVLQEKVHQRLFQVTGSGFWQVHPRAAITLVDAVLAGAGVRPGDRVLDLYAGVGLFSAFLADEATETGRVLSVEGDRQGSADARVNLAPMPQCDVIRAPVERALARGSLGDHADVVVLDPPRTGAKNAVGAIAELGPRRIVYVACDPSALGRDLGKLAEHGYALVGLRAFALFPMTHHVECVAVLAPA